MFGWWILLVTDRDNKLISVYFFLPTTLCKPYKWIIECLNKIINEDLDLFRIISQMIIKAFSCLSLFSAQVQPAWWHCCRTESSQWPMLETLGGCCVTKMGMLLHSHMTTNRISLKSARGSKGQVNAKINNSQRYRHLEPGPHFP